MQGEKTARGALSLRAAVQLAGVHTWPAAVLPVLLGTVLAAARGAVLRPWMALLTLLVAVALQSAVNTLNDYRDFVSGLDTAENCTDATDAALIYEGVRPRAALALGLGFLLFAALCGGALVHLTTAQLLWYALAAAGAIALYTLPGVSFSALPLGELLSGAAMGGALSCAAFHAQAQAPDARTLLCTLPAVLTIGCILLVNNLCDIEKDAAGGRHTLPVLLGRQPATRLLRALLAAAALSAAAIVLRWFPRGAAAMVLLPAGWLLPPLRALFLQMLTPARRGACMAGALLCHKWIIGLYAAAIALSALSA